MPYRTVLLDADNTLFDFTRAERATLTECLSVRGLPCDDHVIARYSEINDSYWKRFERGEITRECVKVERFVTLFAELGVDADPVSISDDYLPTLATKAYLIDGALDFCRRLRDASCRLYMVTNGTASVQHSRLGVSPITPLFDGIFISEEVGASKPSAAYFDYVKAHIPDFDPADAIVIGDSLSSDVQGGINAGLATCWYNPTHKSVPEDMPIDYVCDNYEDILNIII